MSEPRLDVSVQDAEGRRLSPWWGVHASRYLFARAYARGRVLDIACGTGYGFALLRPNATTVVGVDVDIEAVRTARREANGDALVLLGDGGRLPFADGTFDAVTSFETIEHLHERARFVGELRRVLAAHGVCVLSTPNANYTRPIDGKPHNPFHVHEYVPDELVFEMRAHFEVVELVGQTLSPRFVMSPFWDDQQRMPRKWGSTASLIVWRALNRLPAAVRDHASRALWGHPFVPAEDDYDFDPASVSAAPVLVAVCRTHAQ